MTKPSDYSKYFDENGKSRKCPYDFHTQESNDWGRRAREIRLSMLPEGLREEFVAYQRKKYLYSSVLTNPEICP